MKKIKQLLSNLVGLVIVIGLFLFVYQNFTGKSIDLTNVSNSLNLSSVKSVDIKQLNLQIFSSLKKQLLATSEKQAKTQVANLVDKQITDWKNQLLKGIISESLEKDTGEVSEKVSGDTKIAIMSDSHESFDNLQKVVEIINKDESFDLAIHLGDLSRVGEQVQLTESKKILDKLEIKYYAIPGDHDFWESVGAENYIKVFGMDYYSVIKNNWKLIFLDNADIENGLNTTQLEWLKSELNATDSKYRVLFLHIPLYSTHSERRVMGGSDQVKKQKEEILNLVRENNVKAVISGDQHYFNIEKDPIKKEIKHIVVGALTNDRNLQPARYGVLLLKSDGRVEVKDEAI